MPDVTLHGTLDGLNSIELTPEFSNQYELGKVLGVGGSAMVVAGIQRSTKRPVAIKFLMRLDSPEVLERSVREAQSLARFRHPHLVRIFDVGEVSGFPYLVLELLSGGSLRDFLKRSGPLPVDEALAIVDQCLSALEACHEAGVIHRDVKPENLLFTADNVLKLTDFGLIHLVEMGARLTETGLVLGTLRYMSPEQLAGAPLGPQTDLYAVGLILVEMLTGRPVFDAPDVARILLLRACPEIPALKESSQQLPPRLAAHLRDVVLAKEAARRPASAAQLAEGLAAAAERPRVQSIVPQTRAPLERPRAERSVAIRGAAVAVFAILAILAIWRIKCRPVNVAASRTVLASHAVPTSPSASHGGARRKAPFWDGWALVARRSAVLTAADPRWPRTRQQLAELSPIKLGRDLQDWMNWYQLGIWLKGKEIGAMPQFVASGPSQISRPLTPEFAARLVSEELVHRSGLWNEDVLHFVFDFPGDGRSWLFLAELLRKEGDVDGARRAVGVGLSNTTPALIANCHDPLWHVLFKAMLTLKVDLVREVPRWVGVNKRPGAAWRALRRLLGRSDPALVRTLLEYGVAHSLDPLIALSELAALEDGCRRPDAARAALSKLIERSSEDLIGCGKAFDYFRMRGQVDEIEKLRAVGLPEWATRWVDVAKGRLDLDLEPAKIVEGEGRSLVYLAEIQRRLENGDREGASRLAAKSDATMASVSDVSHVVYIIMLGAGLKLSVAQQQFAELPFDSPDDNRAWLLALDSAATAAGREWIRSELARVRCALPQDPVFIALCALERSRAGDHAAALALVESIGDFEPADETTRNAVLETLLRPLWQSLAGERVETSSLDSVARLARLKVGSWAAEILDPFLRRDVLSARRILRIRCESHPDFSVHFLALANLNRCSPTEAKEREEVARLLAAARLSLKGLDVILQIRSIEQSLRPAYSPAPK